MIAHDAIRILRDVRFLSYQFSYEGSLNDSGDRGWLRISHNPPDTQDRTKALPLIFQTSVDLRQFSTPEFFIKWVFEYGVMNVLRHEAGELFKVRDIDVYNQHDDQHRKINMIDSMYTLQPNYFNYGIRRQEDRFIPYPISNQS